MKIGDYVTTQEIMNQSKCRWVVLSDLVLGEYNAVEGGIIRVIADTKKESWEKEVELGLADEDTILIGGSGQGLIVGGVLVE